MSREGAGAVVAGSLARTRVRWARRRLDGPLRGPYRLDDEIRAAVYAVNELEAALVLYVEAARDRGLSWQAIGAALGVSRQAARQRYAGAVRRREALRSDTRRQELVGTSAVSVEYVRGVWEGHAMRLNGRRAEPGE